MRGHGDSPTIPDDQAAYSEEATVADMAALLDAVGAKKAIVGGLSLGGYMSLAFNRAHPDRVAALLIIDTGPGYRNDEAARRAGTQTSIAPRRTLRDATGWRRLGNASAEVRTARAPLRRRPGQGRARHADPARRRG